MVSEKPAALRLMEYERGQPFEQMLRDLYGQGLTQSEVAATLGVPRSTLARWEDRIGLRMVRFLASTQEIIG